MSPPFTAQRRGIPYELMGFGYDGLHEMWDGYREGISALALLVKPPDTFYTESDGIRVAWLVGRRPGCTLRRDAGLHPGAAPQSRTGG